MMSDLRSRLQASGTVIVPTRGGKTLPTAVQTALVDFFAANDLSLTEYWPVDVKQVDWQDEWSEFVKDAGLTAAWQMGAVLRWIENKHGAVVSSSPSEQVTARTIAPTG